MQQTFSLEELLVYFRMRWRIVAIVCAITLALTFGISLWMTPRYTATVSVVIDPPAGSDPRGATAISPVYLESLRTYESYAGSDALFALAVDRFHLRQQGNEPIETLKRQILRVSKMKDSRILQIRAILPDPAKAREVSLFVANETVRLSHKVAGEPEEDLIRHAEQQLAQSRAAYADALSALAQFGGQTPVESLQIEMDTLQAVSSKVLRDSLEAEADAEDYLSREKVMTSAPKADDDTRFVHQEVSARTARAQFLKQKAGELQKSLVAKGVELGRRTARQNVLEAELKMAQTATEAANARLREVRGAQGTRGEVLTIIDQGILPQKPSSPNIPLYVISALFMAMVLSFSYLTIAFGLESGMAEGRMLEARRVTAERYGER